MGRSHDSERRHFLLDAARAQQIGGVRPQLFVAVSLAACGSNGSSSLGDNADVGTSVSLDATTKEDAGTQADLAMPPDGGMLDLGGTDLGPDDLGLEDLGLEDVGAHDVVDWTLELPGTYEGEEFAPSIGRITARFDVRYDETTAHFDVRVVGDSRVKFYFTGIEPDPSDPGRAYVLFPQQVYAEGATGPVVLEAEGTGTFIVEGLEGAFDGTVELDPTTILLLGQITVRGTTESFSVRLER